MPTIRKLFAAKTRANCSSVAARIGSAPQKATRQLSRRNLRRSSSGMRDAALVVSEIRRSAQRGAELPDCFEPAGRALRDGKR